MIQAIGLQKYYNGGAIKALDGVDAEINRGEVVVVIGRPVPVNPPSCAV